MTRPRYLYLGASDYALRLLRAIRATGDGELLYLLDTAIEDRRAEIAAAAELPVERVLDTAALRDPAFLARLGDDRPDFALSAHFGEILPEAVFALPRHGVANLHSALLPYNRGHWPEIWSIVRGTPAGITLHYIGQGIDTGDIIDQVPVAVRPEDTCESLAGRIEVEGIALVVRNWRAMLTGTARATPQAAKHPINLHRHLDSLAQIDLDQTYTGKQLIDVLRALTLPRLLPGAFFVDPATGDRIRIQISLTREPSGGSPS